MAYRLVRTPWAVAARGAAAAGFGAVTFAWSSITVAAFVGLFAAYALVDGALVLLTARRFRARGSDARGLRDPLFVQGLLGVAGGLAAALWPGVTMQALLALVAAWAALTGLAQLYVATRGRARLPGFWLLGGAGAAGVALAALLALALAAGDVRVGLVVAAYGLAVGGLLGALAWRLLTADRPAEGDDPAVVPALSAEAAP